MGRNGTDQWKEPADPRPSRQGILCTDPIRRHQCRPANNKQGDCGGTLAGSKEDACIVLRCRQHQGLLIFPCPKNGCDTGDKGKHLQMGKGLRRV